MIAHQAMRGVLRIFGDILDGRKRKSAVVTAIHYIANKNQIGLRFADIRQPVQHFCQQVGTPVDITDDIKRPVRQDRRRKHSRPCLIGGFSEKSF